jgi:hypothetical protein
MPLSVNRRNETIVNFALPRYRVQHGPVQKISVGKDKKDTEMKVKGRE